jgi:hypothetical protein
MLPQPPANAFAVPTMFGENMIDVLRAMPSITRELNTCCRSCSCACRVRMLLCGTWTSGELPLRGAHQNWQHTKHARLKPMQQRTMMKPVEPVTIDIRNTAQGRTMYEQVAVYLTFGALRCAAEVTER